MSSYILRSDGQIGRIEPCSRNCPWSAAETVLSEVLVDDDDEVNK